MTQLYTNWLDFSLAELFLFADLQIIYLLWLSLQKRIQGIHVFFWDNFFTNWNSNYKGIIFFSITKHPFDNPVRLVKDITPTRLSKQCHFSLFPLSVHFFLKWEHYKCKEPLKRRRQEPKDTNTN